MGEVEKVLLKGRLNLSGVMMDYTCSKYINTSETQKVNTKVDGP